MQSWPDRSGLANDARRQLDDPLYPLLVQDEARTVAEEALRRSVVLTGNWLALPQPPGDPSLRFGREEFLVLVAASVPSTQRSDTAPGRTAEGSAYTRTSSNRPRPTR